NVCNGTPHWPHCISRTGNGYGPAAVVRRFGASVANGETKTHSASQCRGNPGRPACISALAGRHDTRGDGNRSSSRRPSRNQARVIRVLYRPGKRRRIGAGDPEGKLVQVGFANENSARIEQLLQGGRGIGRLSMLQGTRTAR